MFWNRDIRNIRLPAVITLVRVAPRTLDDDNLVTAFKWIRDKVADLITPGMAPGRADNIKGLSFAYRQEKAPRDGFKIIADEIDP